MPFETKELNTLELFHIITILVTFYSGIYYFSNITTGTALLMLIITLAVNAAFIIVWIRFASSAYVKKIKTILANRKEAIKAAKEKKQAAKDEAMKFAAANDLHNSPEMKEVRFLFNKDQTKRLDKAKRKKTRTTIDAVSPESVFLHDESMTSLMPPTIEDVSPMVPVKVPVDEEEKISRNSTLTDISVAPSMTSINTIERPPSAIKRDPGRRNIRIKRKLAVPKLMKPDN